MNEWINECLIEEQRRLDKFKNSPKGANIGLNSFNIGPAIFLKRISFAFLFFIRYALKDKWEYVKSKFDCFEMCFGFQAIFLRWRTPTKNGDAKKAKWYESAWQWN